MFLTGSPLGIVAYPNEVNRTLTGTPMGSGLGIPISHTYGLGNVPNDIDLARYRDTWYQGVHHGWINGKHRFYPDGNLGYTSPTVRRIPYPEGLGPNLGNTSTAIRGILGLDSSEASLEEIAKAERTKAVMSIVSAVAVSTVALLSIIAFVKGR